jgi:hypothetical protein
MREVSKKQFVTIFVLVALLTCVGLLFVLWQESSSNLEVVKRNAVRALDECYGVKGVPYAWNPRDLNGVDLNDLRIVGGLS